MWKDLSYDIYWPIPVFISQSKPFLRKEPSFSITLSDQPPRVFFFLKMIHGES